MNDGPIIDVSSREEPAEPDLGIQAPEPIPCRTAFLVYIDPNGKAFANSDLNLPIVPERDADIVDMRRACHEVVDDVSELLVTQRIINTQMQVAHQVAQQAQTDALAAQLNGQHPAGIPNLADLRGRRR